MLVLEQTSLNILCWCYASDDIYINQPISVIIRRKWGKKHFNCHFHVNFRVIEMAVKKEKGELISIEGFSLIRFFFQNIRKTFLHHFTFLFHVHFQNPNPSIKFWLSNPSLHMATVVLTCVQMQCRFLIRKPKNWCSKIRLVFLEC